MLLGRCVVAFHNEAGEENGVDKRGAWEVYP